MKISTKGRYALRVMLELALYNTGEPVALKDVAERQGLSEKYLEQIISLLNRGGLVRSVRGAKGGYALVGKPEDYTVGKILRVTEGDLSVVECLSGGAPPCDRYDNCVTIRVWEKLNEAISSVIDNTTLADLMEWQAEMGNQYII